MSLEAGQRTLRQSLRLAVWLYLAGCVLFWFLWSQQASAWFGLGGALALANLFISAYMVNFGLKKLSNQGLMIGLILFKTVAFLCAVGAILVFFKPAFLPFTMGVLLVIFSLVIWSVVEAARLRRNSET